VLYCRVVPTQAERSAATIKRLRRAARELFGRRGFEAVSVDDIASAARVTRGAFYHHFESKEALFESVFVEVQSTLVDHVRAAARQHRDPLEQLRAGTDAFIDAASRPAASRIALIDGPAVLGPSRYRELEEAAFVGLVRSSVDRLQTTSPPFEQALIAHALSAAVCELATHAATRRDDRQVAKSVAGIVVDALGQPRRTADRPPDST